MIIDPIDLRLIRQLELQGSISVDEIVSKFHITREEIFLRIKNFEDSCFITGYGMKLFLPKITGGRWFWGCAATEATARFKPEKCVPYLEEIVENLAGNVFMTVGKRGLAYFAIDVAGVDYIPDVNVQAFEVYQVPASLALTVPMVIAIGSGVVIIGAIGAIIRVKRRESP